ncbi:hypothetical protein GU926_08215 [Nibribacter ruber]|uniref:Uncharacterized protein n=1 Tax=Nibribacter ruber TaxID=2698458 RepID=A0A6P1NWJ2_9BACT|nr:hypothetical protein [Nibribacter ruber]QHL87420.1 hypothetical protein GU926_08215 [Nibribacter ruber]
MDLLDLKEPDGTDNTPGIRTDLYIAPENEFLLLKGLKTTELPGDEVTIDGAHTFADGKGFSEVYATMDSAELKLDPVGDPDGTGFKGSFEFFHPGTSKEAAVFARKVKNKNCIMIVPQADGTKIQLGSKGLGVRITPSYSSGKLSGGRRGWTFKCEYYTNLLAFYEGDIVLKSAVVVGP